MIDSPQEHITPLLWSIADIPPNPHIPAAMIYLYISESEASERRFIPVVISSIPAVIIVHISGIFNVIIICAIIENNIIYAPTITRTSKLFMIICSNIQ